MGCIEYSVAEFGLPTGGKTKNTSLNVNSLRENVPCLMLLFLRHTSVSLIKIGQCS